MRVVLSTLWLIHMLLSGTLCEAMHQSSPNKRVKLGREKSFYIPGTSPENPVGEYSSRKGIKHPIVDFEKLLHLAEIHKIINGRAINVGVFESGTDVLHPMVKKCFKESQNSLISCYENHGTAVASIIARVAPQSSLMFFPKLSKAISGINILNCSRGFFSKNRDKKEANFNPFVSPSINILKYIIQSGIIVVKSAGNEQEQLNDSLLRFVEEDTSGRMILVGNLNYINKNEELNKRSVYTPYQEAPFICTVGSNLLVAAPNTEHRVSSGTSYSAPIITGAIALLMEAYPQWKEAHPEKYIDFILRSARKNPALQGQCGRGVLDIRGALEEANMEMLLEKIQEQIDQLDHVDLDIIASKIPSYNLGINSEKMEFLSNIGVLFPLFISRGNTSLIKKLLVTYPQMLNQRIDDPRFKKVTEIDVDEKVRTPLELAILSGQADVVEVLLENGAKPDLDDPEILFSLVKLGKFGLKTTMLLKDLVEKINIPYPVDSYGRSLLMVAAYFKAPKEILDVLMSRSQRTAQDQWGYTDIDWAIMGKSPELGALLEGQDVNKTNTIKNDRTYLHFAAAGNDVHAINLLLANGANISAKNQFGNTPLYVAAKNNAVGALETLIENGANIDESDKSGKTALHEAAKNNAVASIKLLIARHAQVNAKDKHGNTPLHLAVLNNALDAIKVLIKSGAHIKAQDENGETPLHAAAGNNAADTIIHTLIAHGAPIEARDKDDDTPLHLATLNNALGALEALIENGAQVDARDKNGYTPLHIAAEHNADDIIIKTLIENGARIEARDKDGNTPLHLAALNNSLEAIKGLLAKGAKVNVQDKYGGTPLHMAALKNTVGAVKLLIAKGAKVNAQDKYGGTPLHLAALNNSLGAIKVLIAKGAKVEAKDLDGNTPLFIASQNNAIEAKKLLLSVLKTIKTTKIKDKAFFKNARE